MSNQSKSEGSQEEDVIESFILLEPGEAETLVKEGRVNVESGKPTDDGEFDWSTTGIEIRGGPINESKVREAARTIAIATAAVLTLTALLSLAGQGGVAL